MDRNILKFSFLVGATLLLTNCGKKEFSSATQDSQVARLNAPTESNTDVPVDQPPQPKPPVVPEDFLIGEQCVATSSWFDEELPLHTPFINDADCVTKMSKLVNNNQAYSGVYWRVHHVTQAQMQVIAARTTKLSQLTGLIRQNSQVLTQVGLGWFDESD